MTSRWDRSRRRSNRHADPRPGPLARGPGAPGRAQPPHLHPAAPLGPPAHRRRRVEVGRRTHGCRSSSTSSRGSSSSTTSSSTSGWSGTTCARRSACSTWSIVIITAPWFLLPGFGGSQILVLARLARLVRLFFVSKGARQLGRRLGSVGSVLRRHAAVLLVDGLRRRAPCQPRVRHLRRLALVGHRHADHRRLRRHRARDPEGPAGRRLPHADGRRHARRHLGHAGQRLPVVQPRHGGRGRRGPGRRRGGDERAPQRRRTGRRPPTTCRRSWPTCRPTSSCSSSTSRRSSSAAARRRRASPIVRCCRAFPPHLRWWP